MTSTQVRDLSPTNQDDVVVLDGTAVAWRDPTVCAHNPSKAGTPAPTQEEFA